GTLALLLTAPFFSALAVAAALALKVGENGLRYSLDQSSRELLYVPVPGAMRAKARAYIDVFFHRGAKGLAALLLLPVTFGLVTAAQAGWLTLGLVAVWLTLVTAATREYISGFRESLKHRSVDRQSPINIEDTATLEVLVQSMASLDSRQVLHSLQILGDHGRANLASPTLLYHDDHEVRLLTLGLLQQAERRDAVPLIERRLGDESPEVRAKAMRVLAKLQGKDVCQLMRPRLTEHEPAVRAAAVACLTAHGDEQMVREAAVVLGELLKAQDGETRAEGAKAIGAVSDPKYSEQLVKLLYDEDQRVLRQAIAAVDRRSQRDGHNPIYTPTLISSLRNRRVKHEARNALVAMGEPVIPALKHFLLDPDESLWVRRALPKTIARIGGPAAADALLAALDHDVHDCFLRRKLIEALRDLPAHLVRSHGAERIPRQVEIEARSYSQRLLEFFSIVPADRVSLSGATITWGAGAWEPQLLERLLAERMEDHLRNLFGLLSLLHPARHIKAAYRGLTSGNASLKASALEYLDNTLEVDLRRTVVLLTNDKPLAEKLEAVRRRFGLRRGNKIDTLRAAISHGPDDDETIVGIALGSLYKIHLDQVEGLFDDVCTLASQATTPQIAETAAWIEERL
ncbi:MAG: HEAT repeat domain-containing protein, partial [Acidobacteriota bacterium]|nr:HEAT repeat domain-containing protein [Acidobacteriota bacterium]